MGYSIYYVRCSDECDCYDNDRAAGRKEQIIFYKCILRLPGWYSGSSDCSDVISCNRMGTGNRNSWCTLPDNDASVAFCRKGKISGRTEKGSFH